MKKILLAVSIFFTACSPTNIATTNSSTNKPISIDGKLFTTLFQQKAAEYRALCLQAFNIARLRLDAYQPQTNKPRAIITDIDETVLDNSPYEAHQTLQGKDYEQASWNEWTDKAAADTVPGGASFLKYAASKGVEIFYITNRGENERASTLKNLQQFSFPNADDAHFLPRGTTSSKETRRQTVASTHEIVMLLGDNLADFSSLFDKKPIDERLQNTNLSSKDFGNRFIVLPNPVYGDWEGALFKYSRELTGAQKDSIIRSAVKTY
ncbi:MAG: 5'-nucleotidase, lipoprotein e(P4) family [Ferruginibacter sp.]